MLEKLLFAVPALAVGSAVALQGVVNAGLARGLGSYVIAAAVSFWVGTTTLTVLVLAMGGVGPALAQGRTLGLGWWLVGGLLGASFVTTMTFIVPKIGIGAASAFAVTGQLITAALLDHFGLLGLPEHPLSLLRALGIGLLIAGVLLVRFF